MIGHHINIKIKALIAAVCIFLAATVVIVIRTPAHEGEKTVTLPFDDGYSITVTYPEVITCGEPVRFNLKMNGGSGSYKYRIYSLNVADNGAQTYVYDISYGDNSLFKEEDYWDFTFYASGEYYIRFSAIDTGVKPMVFKDTGYFGITFTIDDPEYPSVEEIVDQVAKECLAAGCESDYEKALWMNDWIVDHCDYDYTYSFCSAEGPLARGKATCEGYSRAYEKLLNAVGVTNVRNPGKGHVWNAVMMDGNWYMVDTTWNGSNNGSEDEFKAHLYFGLPDEVMTDVQSYTPDESRLCTSYEQNYFVRSGKIAQWSDPLAAQAAEKIAAGETGFDIPVDHVYYSNVLYRIVAYVLNQTQWDAGGMEAEATFTYVAKDSINGTMKCKVNYTPKDQGGEEPTEPVKPEEPDEPTEPDEPIIPGVDPDATDIIYTTYKGESAWWFVKGGKVVPDHTGVEHNSNGWWFVKNGKVDFDHNGVECNSNGWWRIENGKVNFDFKGFAENVNGWWYLDGGKVQFGKTEIIYGTVKGEAAWWNVKGGQVRFEKTVANNANGWWYVEGGKVNFNYTGVAQNDLGWWRIENGKVNFNYTGVANNEFGWWRIENGKVNFDFKGFADNANGWWYLEGGKVQFGISGYYYGTVNGKYGRYYVKDGKVTF